METLAPPVERIKQRILDNLNLGLARQNRYATRNDWYTALAWTVRELMVTHWQRVTETMRKHGQRVVAYLSAEFLPGPHLHNNLINLGIYDDVHQAISELGQDLQDLIDQEEDPGLGNGGLGRLASCYMDSLATEEIAAIGYGIRYEFGIFDQRIRDGWQVEITDEWLRNGNPWEIARPETFHYVQLGGHTESFTDASGRYRVRWMPHRVVKGVAYDTPVLGYGVPWANLLRLWKAEAHESFDFQAFNTGNYYGAVEEKVFSENISKVLYPNDEQLQGKVLRLEQQYFFTSCALQDMVRLHLLRQHPIEEFHEYWAAQLNDTHPSIGVVELMRLLVDEHNVEWELAWEITTATFGYTNHTLLPEALEKWSLSLFGNLLPRHLEIIYEINRRFLDNVRGRFPGDDGLVSRLSLIDESGEKYVRMAHLASVGSHRINGVAELHSELLKRDVLCDFYRMFPERFVNVTNGVTPRRWIALANPSLAALITRKLGDGWLSKLETALRPLEQFADNEEVQHEWREIKAANKRDLARVIHERADVEVDPSSMFDIQVKRLHEYKRQHLNVLHIITLYQQLKRDPGRAMTPRTFVFGGKAAPGYFMAKLMIKLIHSVAGVVNNDPAVEGRLRVVFLPDYNVKHSLHVYPAADLSEQISTAGKEASGTGNMKFGLNGSLTIGTLDGANVEIRQEVGEENFFLFGLTADQVYQTKAQGYRPRDYYDSNPRLRDVIDAMSSGAFSGGDRELFRPMIDSLMNSDPYLLFADYQAYIDCQERVSQAYQDQRAWTRMSILNAARMGKFSSDRSILEYAKLIWGV
jgi:glycogen phosphorylase